MSEIRDKIRKILELDNEIYLTSDTEREKVKEFIKKVIQEYNLWDEICDDKKGGKKVIILDPKTHGTIVGI